MLKFSQRFYYLMHYFLRRAMLCPWFPFVPDDMDVNHFIFPWYTYPIHYDSDFKQVWFSINVQTHLLFIYLLKGDLNKINAINGFM